MHHYLVKHPVLRLKKRGFKASKPLLKYTFAFLLYSAMDSMKVLCCGTEIWRISPKI